MENVLYALFLGIFFYLWYDSLQRTLEEVADMGRDGGLGAEPYDAGALADVMVLLVAKSVLAAALVSAVLWLLQEGLGLLHAYRPVGTSAAAAADGGSAPSHPGLDGATFPKLSMAGLNVLFHDFVCVLLVYRLNFLFTKWYVSAVLQPARLRDPQYVRAQVPAVYVCNLVLFVGSFTAARHFARRLLDQRSPAA